MGTIAEVLAAVDAGEVDLGLRRHRELHRGHGQRHDRRPGLRARPAHPARGRPRHPAQPAGPARRRRSPTSSGSSPSRSPRASAAPGWPRELPGVEVVAANSTAEAARLVGEEADGALGRHRPGPGRQDLRPRRAGHRHRGPPRERDPVRPGRPGRRPAAHRPRQDDDRRVPAGRPAGSLLAILQEFAARAINLTKLESRPTKKALGDYCFIIDLEGHIADELVADCLRDLRSKVADIKFLGSYPAAGAHGPDGPPRGRGGLARRRRLARRPARQAPARA